MSLYYQDHDESCFVFLIIDSKANCVTYSVDLAWPSKKLPKHQALERDMINSMLQSLKYVKMIWQLSYSVYTLNYNGKL